MNREYTRALNATKLERVFAKPFVASLDGHRDGVNCMAKHTKSLSTLLSGSCDGEVISGQRFSLCNFLCCDVQCDFIDIALKHCLWSPGENVGSFQTRMCPLTSSTWRICSGNCRPLLWDIFLYGNWCLLKWYVQAYFISNKLLLFKIYIFMHFFAFYQIGWWWQNHQAVENGTTWLWRRRGATKHYSRQSKEVKEVFQPGLP